MFGTKRQQRAPRIKAEAETMLSSELQQPNTKPLHGSALIVTFVLLVGLPLTAASFYMFVTGGNSDLAGFFVCAGWLAVFGVSYLEVLGMRSRAPYGAPSLVTYVALLEFGLIPAWRVLTGVDSVDGLYVKAMFLVAAGFTAFWVGSWVAMRRATLRFRPKSVLTSDRVALATVPMLGIGIVVKLFLWKAGLSSYMAEAADREAAGSYLQWVGIGEKLLIASMVISGIEFLGKKSTNLAVRLVFWLSLGASLFFGLISGMKSEFLAPLALVVLILWTTRGRLPRSVFVLPVLLVLMYPFVNSYRHTLNNGYRQEATSISGLAAIMEDSFKEAYTPRADTEEGTLDSGVANSSDRLSLISCVRLIVGLPSPSLLNGDEKLWMAPIYPFIPRAIWKSKPVLNKGARLSVAAGDSAFTSTAVTPIGDLFILGGVPAILLGMLLYGVILQLLMNWIAGDFAEKGLFIYLSSLPMLTGLENDVVSMISGTISVLLINLVIAKIVYGEGFFTFRARPEALPIHT